MGFGGRRVVARGLATKPRICTSTFSTVNCGGMTPMVSRSFKLSISWSNLRGNLSSRAM